MSSELTPGFRRSAGLVDVLDRVLDKGLVVAGDIKVSLAEVELLTIRVRLLICSVDKAEQIGLDWWRADPHLSSSAGKLRLENEELRARLLLLEDRLRALDDGAETPVRARRARKKKQGVQSARPTRTGRSGSRRNGSRSERE